MGAKHFFQLCKPAQVKFSSIYETQAKKVQQRQNSINIYIQECHWFKVNLYIYFKDTNTVCITLLTNILHFIIKFLYVF